MWTGSESDIRRAPSTAWRSALRLLPDSSLAGDVEMRAERRIRGPDAHRVETCILQVVVLHQNRFGQRKMVRVGIQSIPSNSAQGKPYLSTRKSSGAMLAK